MTNKCILLQKEKSMDSVVSIISMSEVVKFITVLCTGLMLFIGCGEPNLADPKVREKVLAEAIDEDNLQIRRAPSGEELRYAPNQEQPYTGWVKIGRRLTQFQQGKPHGLSIRWYSNYQKAEKGSLMNGLRNGLWTRWYESGQKSSAGTYEDGIKNGLWTEWYANGQRRSEKNYKSGMLLIPAGEFQMGSNGSDADDDEKPVHTVYVDAFYMDVYEVTNAQYKKFVDDRKFVDANPQWGKDRIPSRYHDGYYLRNWTGNSYPRGKGNHPVVYVSWYGAMAYAEWAGKRLPTEAEWEKAARGGLVGKKYPWGDSPPDSSKANYGKNVEGTTPVGSYPPNGYGLYDMAGNVWEWCLDASDGNFYKNSPRRNPIAGADSIAYMIDNFTSVKNNRALRGGSWGLYPKGLRVAHRYGYGPTAASNYGGFRCARTVSP